MFIIKICEASILLIHANIFRRETTASVEYQPETDESLRSESKLTEGLCHHLVVKHGLRSVLKRDASQGSSTPRLLFSFVLNTATQTQL